MPIIVQVYISCLHYAISFFYSLSFLTILNIPFYSGYESPGEWENHQMFFGADGSQVQYQVTNIKTSHLLLDLVLIHLYHPGWAE